MAVDISSLLKLMVHKQASDLFITAGVSPSMKVSGKLMKVTKEALTPDQARDLVLGTMNDHQRAEFDAHNECQYALSLSGVGRFRVSAFVQRSHVGMVIRRIEVKIPQFDELNLPPVIRQLAMTKRGLIIFVGGTGTGKSTSLAAMVGYRNQNSSGHIITIEDPIEFVHQHAGCIITQREVGVDTESFEVALKNTLRQAPDVILLGEIRARETMDYAVAFAETGHLCLATLHANNANQALDRIINFFPEDRRDQLFMDLSLNLRSLVAQQLIPTKDGVGRCAAVEVLVNTPLAADMIRKGEVHKLKELMKQSTQQGMQTFDQALYRLFKEGRITEEHAVSYADSANEVRLMIKLDRDGGSDLSAGLDGVQLLGDD